ncbi:TetR/AcrR family transcriptional regulator [Sporolactobacillus laevolacticus]|uniref:TetR/AcrR family transcriptional regulator n=1 Tax=Sporolactobacillus laevolacticus TaxID=33018 RepID=UPI0025B461F9|nr:TetR/AcrR family transcriptional regulator [Sporolactobacillus laevolacticus]MDN3955898.1 TetR/AcrR family transcriptional regulator [Sporolactobacillus laevolacticus]
MARNKYPEVTVNRILDVSLKLFLEKGYEETTIQDIVDHLGDLTKGAIYHHFRSKEEIIDAVTERLFQEHTSFDQIKNDRSMNGLQKLKKVFIAPSSHKEQRQLYRSVLSVMKNPKFLSKQISNISIYAPLLQDIIEEGIEDGSIVTDCSKELSEVVMLLFNVWINPGIFAVNKDQFTNKIYFLKKLLNNIGLPIIDDEIMAAFNDFRDAIFF